MGNKLTSTELLELAFLVEDKSHTPLKEVRIHYINLHKKLISIVKELDSLEATSMSFAQIPIVLNKMSASYKNSLNPIPTTTNKTEETNPTDEPAEKQKEGNT